MEELPPTTVSHLDIPCGTSWYCMTLCCTLLVATTAPRLQVDNRYEKGYATMKFWVWILWYSTKNVTYGTQQYCMLLYCMLLYCTVLFKRS